MSYQGVVNIIRGVAQAVNPTGFFEHGRTWDASLNFDEGDPQIFLYPLQNTVDESNNYFETWQVVMGFFFQDTQDSTPAEREDIIANADDLLRSFIATISQVEGIAIAGVRTEPRYRQMAGTYSGMLLNFTLGATSNVCDEEAPPDIPNVPTFCEKVQTCLGISPTGSATEYLNRQGEWTTPAGGGGAGTNGWTPVLAVVTDGTRRVQQVTDWTGGTGAKPATGKYVGASGFVTDIADAVDIRGAQGATGTTGATGPQGPQGEPGTVSLVSGNGTTFDTDHYDLGGTVTDNIALEFDPAVYGVVLGDLNTGKAVIIGNGLGSDEFLFVIGGADSAAVTAKAIALETTDGGDVAITSDNQFTVNAASNVYLDSGSRVALSANDNVSDYNGSLVIDPYATDPAVGLSLRKNQDTEAGFFAIDDGTKRYANIYAARLDSGNNAIDITRIEANETSAHMRHIYDEVNQFFNGIHVAPTYSQLEYGKEQEDGQLTGINLTVNATGVHHYEGGFIVNSFDNFGNFTIGDPTTDGAWRTYRDNDNNLLTQARVSGAWVTIQQLNYP